MAGSARRISCLLEALAFAALVALYIWRLQAASLWSWTLLLAWLIVSFLLRGDTTKTMGWRADNLWPSTLHALWFFVPASLLLCAAGLFLGMLHRLPEHLIDPRRFVGYLSFCLLQQVALNSFLTNRLLCAFHNSASAALVSGALFAILHWPNPVLVPLTLIGGVAMAWLFARERNILPLALGQAILGALVWWAFPILWHHSMRVGPGYSTFHM
ncbi:MAG TPA: CPBP family intramembrane glutamic endopeptidase [Candidatus Acidoferrum sp.]